MNDIFDFLKLPLGKDQLFQVLYANDYDDDDCNEQRVKSC